MFLQPIIQIGDNGNSGGFELFSGVYGGVWWFEEALLSPSYVWDRSDGGGCSPVGGNKAASQDGLERKLKGEREG